MLPASDELDQGETQFYAMDGYLTRGSLRIGMVKILRDDLRATHTELGSFGRAHTSLAWPLHGTNQSCRTTTWHWKSPKHGWECKSPSMMRTGISSQHCHFRNSFRGSSPLLRLPACSDTANIHAVPNVHRPGEPVANDALTSAHIGYSKCESS